MKKIVASSLLIGSLFIANEASAQESHTVQSGDSLWKISHDYGVSISQLKELNNLSNSVIYPNQKLVIDAKAKIAENTSSAPATTSTYMVQSGDTLSKIASMHSTSVSKLLELNPSITNGNYIYVNQEINVSGQQTTTTTTTKKSTVTETTSEYTVKGGDSLSRIASKHGISLNEILSLNPQISNPSLIRVGQTVKVSGQVSSKSSTTTTTTTTTGNNVSASGQSIVATGMDYIGTPYLFGASTGQTNTFDCSSYMHHIFGEHGINLPRTSRQQAQLGTTVSYSNLQKGDLVFFDTNHDGVINHVGVYVGNNEMLSATSSSGVKVSNMAYYWKDRYVTAKRIL
ncbi:peptidase P60 [Pontibacillus halophilus JSM 076056 = DSM 19796]|uniref:Peptidase P60 n=1 Tax=Pontibacillus halophilus JSM 076056 = DSM 19796 TaxID=1385510 RepID=A0A0A5GAP9_9BACI|nr:C40 family peptidase [Pontibacillus halophilus]KGX90251.1 peptidase P60 [Pontibacillus halophilus JSM 076056 = DSM 19796]